MKRFILVAALALSASPVIAQSVGETTGVNSALGLTPSTPDFVLQAAISDMFEIQSSELALRRGDERTKKFASDMIAAHEKTSEELKAAAQAAGVAVPTEMDSSHKEMLAELQGKQGPEFNDAYQDQQEDAHEAAVSLFQRYGDGGDNPALKEWAAKTRPHLEEHLKMAEALDD
jgi:putative membrane protein